jgi:aspartate kinase
VVGVASESDLLVLQAAEQELPLLEFLDDHKVAGKQLHFATCGGSADGLSLILSRDNLHDEERFRSQLSQRFGAGVQLRDGVGAVSVIGTGINSSYRNVLDGSRELAEYELLGISTSSFRITWLLPASAVANSVRKLHHLFLDSRAPVVP